MRRLEYTDAFESSRALLERGGSIGDGNEPGNRLTALGDDPLFSELHVAQELAQACFCVANAGRPSFRALCSSHDYMVV